MPGVLLVGLGGVPCRHRAFLQVRVPAALEAGRGPGVRVELDDPRDRPLEEGTVVAHEEQRGLVADDEGLQPVEGGEVEVVGRLVEEQDVVRDRRIGRELGARRLATGERRRRLVEEAGGEAEVGPDRTDAALEVGAAEGQPAVEGLGVAVVGAGLALRQRRRSRRAARREQR